MRTLPADASIEEERSGRCGDRAARGRRASFHSRSSRRSSRSDSAPTRACCRGSGSGLSGLGRETAQHQLDGVLEDLLERVAAQTARSLRRFALDQAVGECPEDVRDLPGIVRDEDALARRRARARPRAAAGTAPRAPSPARPPVGQLADHRLVLERPEDLEVLAMRRPVRDVEAARCAGPARRAAARVRSSRASCARRRRRWRRAPRRTARPCSRSSDRACPSRRPRPTRPRRDWRP